MNELLEKARRDYPIGTKVKSMKDGTEHTITRNTFEHYGNVYTFDENGDIRCIYDKALNQWAEIIKEETVNNLLEKAKRDYPIGTKISGMYKSNDYVVTKPIFIRYENVYTFDEKGDIRCIYDKSDNQWAEIIKENTMTQQEFNSLEVGDFISNYEILHKYKEFLIVRCDDGHDLFDLEKINKLGLKIKPKTFMGLEVKKYDNVPCEIDNRLYYLIEVAKNEVIFKTNKKQSTPYIDTPTSIRIL